MPSTILGLLQSAGLKLAAAVRWGERVGSANAGVYLVSLSSSPDKNLGAANLAPIALGSIEDWLARVPMLRIDGAVCTRGEELRERLARFWLADENVIYVGKAASLRGRIGAYYRTPLGDRRPHAGGHWVKTLSVLDRLHVYLAETTEPAEAEKCLLASFRDGVSQAARVQLMDPKLPIPFANLEFPPGTRKKHGLSRCRVSGPAT